MTRLLPLNPVLHADLLTVGSLTRLWSPRASVTCGEPLDWLRLADGTRRLGQVLQAAPDPESALRVLHTLAEHDLLGAGPRDLSLRVAIIGQGRLARDISNALATEQVHLVLAGAARPGAGHGVRATWDPTVTPGAVARVSHHEHWSQVSASTCAVALVAAETCEPDRAILHHLRSRHVRHLVVKAHRDTATIGPLWPTESAGCTTCIDLSIRGKDPAWGNVVMALTQREADPDGEISLAAAALAVQRLRELERSCPPDAVTVVSPHAVDQQYWPAHPDCANHQPTTRAVSRTRALPLRSGGRTDRLTASDHAAA